MDSGSTHWFVTCFSSLKSRSVPQLEGPTTKMCNYVLGGFGEKKQKKKEDWQQLLAQVPIFKKIVPFILIKGTFFTFYF